MAKTTRILIPSDFTVDSLDFVRQSIEESVAEQIDIILVYGNKSSSSASELLGIGLDDQLDMLQSESFLNACRVLYQLYQDRHLNIFADILCTDNKNYLRHYLRGQAVDEIRIPCNYNYKKKTRHFFNVAEALRNLGGQIRSTVLFSDKGDPSHHKMALTNG